MVPKSPSQVPLGTDLDLGAMLQGANRHAARGVEQRGRDARATPVEVEDVSADDVRLTVTDDGVGRWAPRSSAAKA